MILSEEQIKEIINIPDKTNLSIQDYKNIIQTYIYEKKNVDIKDIILENTLVSNMLFNIACSVSFEYYVNKFKN